MNGWIKVHRALAEHHVASDPHSLSVWIHMLMLANHRESKRQINGRVLVISPGQLITSRKSLADKTGVNESKVERILKMLQSEQLIEQHGTSKFRVISIVNWAKYQTDEQQDEQQVNSRRTASEQQMNTPEEIPNGIKNGKNVEKDQKPCDQQAESRDSLKIPYEEILDAFKSRLPSFPQPRRPLDDDRKRAVRSLWTKKEQYGSVDFFDRYFNHVSESEFLSGWKGCGFDWLMKPANFRKVIEGNYHGEARHA